jgi:endogenous inhibitor of DNA gyrase (YacG/DUF329 family)
MGGACKYCGAPVEWKNEVGHYRAFCRSCANAIAGGHDLTASYDPDDDPLDDPEREYE